MADPACAADGARAVTPDRLSSQDEELRSLRQEVERCHAVERELMQLLGCSRADRIVHDLRNLLQERIFLLAACKDVDESRTSDR